MTSRKRFFIALIVGCLLLAGAASSNEFISCKTSGCPEFAGCGGDFGQRLGCKVQCYRISEGFWIVPAGSAVCGDTEKPWEQPETGG